MRLWGASRAPASQEAAEISETRHDEENLTGNDERRSMLDSKGGSGVYPSFSVLEMIDLNERPGVNPCEGSPQASTARDTETEINTALSSPDSGRSSKRIKGNDRLSAETTVLSDGWGTYLRRSLYAVFLTSKMNILLVFVPLAIVSSSLKWVEWLTFVFSLLSLCPLAERLGYATEQMAMYTNNTIGGLLNASFGNATELVVALYALTGGQLRVVQLSLLGSILSNMLLVLGFAFFLGGLRYKTQRFAKEGATASSRLLLLSMFGLLLPNMLHVTHTELRDGFDTLALSRQCSIVLIGMYGAFLYFQLVSHRELYEPKENEQDEDEEDDDDEPVLGFWGAMVWLAILTVFAAILSGFVVETIDVAAKQIGLSIGFISTILLPIVGNASDHAASVMFAMKNKMDISLGVAIGSSTQIGMCVIPLLVLVAWALHIPLALDFHAFETGVLFSSVVVVCLCIQDGQSNWLQGLTLILVYVVVGIAFFHHDDPEALISTDPGA